MKSEIVFALDNAGWPALLVDSSGKIHRANQTALSTLQSIQEGSTPLSEIWPAENITPSGDYLENVEYSMAKHSLLKFKTKDGSASFVTYVSTLLRGETKFFVLQLFKPQGAPTSAHAEAAPKVKAAEASSVDVMLAQKQKLDCALQLARTVSLDFNNALTSILGHTSLLLGKADADHAWRNSLVEIEKSAAKAAEIANDLANFSRQEKDNRTQQAGNLNLLLQHCIDIFRTSENQHIEWNLQLERKIFSATFDEAKMQQAFVKILENAVQSISERGQITVQSRNLELTEMMQDRTVKLMPGNYVCVEISDTGCGIKPEALVRIFEPFFTTKGQSHRGLGIGLGLRNCYQSRGRSCNFKPGGHWNVGQNLSAGIEKSRQRSSNGIGRFVRGGNRFDSG